MEFIEFKIRPIQRLMFQETFLEILKEGKITCKQWGIQNDVNYVIFEIPKYCIDKMTKEHVDSLESFVII